jgi:hypothetical protein
MFVRWKQRSIWRNRPGLGRQNTGRVLLVAVLVKSERRGGRPRQRTVAYLGAIERDRTEDPGRRYHFWKAVSARLNSLNVDAPQREKIETALRARVRQPTAEEAQHLEEAVAAIRSLIH